MGSLASRFEHFRSHYTQPDDDTAVWTLRRLEHDDRMAEAWASLDKCDPEAFQHILCCILGCKWKADNFASYPSWKAGLEARNAQLSAAASALSDFFAEMPILEQDHQETAPIIKEHNTKIRECRVSLAWAKDYIERSEKLSSVQLKRDMPASQKRNSPPVTFGVLLCKSMSDRIGQPLYSFVATTGTVIYQLRVLTKDSSELFSIG